ncbi:MAG TPA: hypothetical protein VLI06_06265 [Solimonas sp.]|nr:hypothetical protein [Solimonas sp.]
MNIPDPYSSPWARVAPALLFAAVALIAAALATEARRLPAAGSNQFEMEYK